MDFKTNCFYDFLYKSICINELQNTKKTVIKIQISSKIIKNGHKNFIVFLIFLSSTHKKPPTTVIDYRWKKINKYT